MAKPTPRRSTVSIKLVDARTRQMRAVLAACKRLGLDQDARRELQEDVVGVASMSAMTDAQLGRLLDHLNRDYKGTNPQRPHLAKIKALWWSLYWLGAVEDPSDKALSAFVKRQTGIAALRFLDHRSAPAVIEALKDWCAREGVAWPDYAGVAAADQRWAIVHELWRRLRGIGKSVDPAVIRCVGSEPSARELDEHIRELGKLWRAARPVKP